MKEKGRGEHGTVGRDEAQDRRGNGADVEKSDERRAPALELPPLIPERQGEGDTQTDAGETGSDHADGGCSLQRVCGTGGKNYRETPSHPPHMHDGRKHTQKNEEEK